MAIALAANRRGDGRDLREAGTVTELIRKAIDGGRAARRCVYFAGAVLAAVLWTAHAGAQQLVNDPIIAQNFASITQVAGGIGPPTQMTFGPDGRLYVATFTSGVKRYDVAPNGSFINPMTVWSRPADFPNGQFNGSLGIAFHQDASLGTVMYLAPAVSSSFNVELNRTQSIIRLTDNDGDGAWGETASGEVNQAIVNNLRVTDLHQVNQLLVRDDTLYVGIGSRTRTGGERSELPGGPNPDDGEFAYTGSINWIRDLTQLSADTTTPNLAGHNITQHHTATQPFTSSDTGKLTVYSTGFRNVYGLALDGDGQLWATMNQNEDPLKPDELHRSDFHDDHGFPKGNEVSGNWKNSLAAKGAGFFQNTEAPVALLGNHASADGLDFTDVNDAFAGHAFIARFSAFDDLIAVNPQSGSLRTVATGFNNPIDVLTDPQGNLLVAQHGGGGRIYRVTLFEGAGALLGDIDRSGAIDAADWAILRDNFNADLAGLTVAQAMARGDLNGDFVNDELDFGLFKSAFDESNGAGAFAALQQVPEPAAAGMLLAALGVAAMRRRPGRLRQHAVVVAAAGTNPLLSKTIQS
jgi:glucose/arabinose dehydrogenase